MRGGANMVPAPLASAYAIRLSFVTVAVMGALLRTVVEPAAQVWFSFATLTLLRPS